MPATYKRSYSSLSKRSRKFVKYSDLELKQHFRPNTSVAVPASTVVLNGLVDVPTGVSAQNKIGAKIRVKSIEVHGSLGANASAPLSTTVSLIRYNTASGSTAGDFLGPFPAPETGVLYAAATNGGPMCGGGPGFHFKKTFPGRGLLITFDREVPSAAITNELRLVFNNPSATATTCVYSSCVKFTDA